MKKTLLAIIALLFLSQFLKAQDAQIGSTMIKNMTQPCIIANYNYAGHVVEGALEKKLKEAKIGKDSKATDNFRVYKGVIYNVFNDYKIDLYYKIEDKTTTSTLYLLVSKGYDNFIKPENDPTIYNNAVKYMNDLINDAVAFKLNEDIVDLEKEISSSEKKMKSLKKPESKILKSKAKIESKISKRNLEINPLKTEMEKQIGLLEVAKSKTATLDQMDALQKEVSKHEDAVKSATKKYENSISGIDDLTKDLKKLEEKLEANKLEQQKQQTEIESQKSNLNKLKTELATIQQ